MPQAGSQPEIINNLKFGVDAGLAMLAGMQLDLFTPLKDGPMSAEQLSSVIGVDPTRLRLLLYVLVAAGLLSEQKGCFSNTDEERRFRVRSLILL